jgi:hypothetical protein
MRFSDRASTFERYLYLDASDVKRQRKQTADEVLKGGDSATTQNRKSVESGGMLLEEC